MPKQTGEGEHDPQFEPVIKLTEQVDTKTGEEEDEVLFKMYVGCAVAFIAQWKRDDGWELMIAQEGQAVPVLKARARVEGTRNGRCPSFVQQGDQEGPSGYEEGQDPQGLREPPQ